MKIISKLSEIEGDSSLGITIGNFDGVHLGHRKLIGEALTKCKGRGLTLVVITFIPHPQEIFSKIENFYLNSFEERRTLLKELGLEFLMEIKFNNALSGLTPEAFLGDYILHDKRVETLYLGHDFSFGKDKSGDLNFVKSFISNTKVTLDIGKEYFKNGAKISSSSIRKLIREGEIPKANEFLGRDFYITGNVIRGIGRGATIGIPTINLETDPKRIFPQNGVYATKVFYNGKYYNSLTNIGYNPTFSTGKDLKIETHILNFSSQIYGEEVNLIFLKKLRDEKKFLNSDDLTKQIQSDIKQRKEML